MTKVRLHLNEDQGLTGVELGVDGPHPHVQVGARIPGRAAQARSADRAIAAIGAVFTLPTVATVLPREAFRAIVAIIALSTGCPR